MAITSANQLELLQTAEAVAREKMIDPEDINLIQIIDKPEDIVDAIFKHYESRGFAPLPSEREMLLNL